jgi:NADH:ubiquinone oxidoreductase subunit E
MSSNLKNQEIAAIIRAAIAKHGSHRDAFIPILSEINQHLGYIPPEVLREVKFQVQSSGENEVIAESQLYSLASFYHMFSTSPRGRHIVKFCESAPCHVVGGREIWVALQKELNIRFGETTPDGKWSLETTSCLGICSVGPVFQVDDELFGNVKPEEIHNILSGYD